MPEPIRSKHVRPTGTARRYSDAVSGSLRALMEQELEAGAPALETEGELAATRALVSMELGRFSKLLEQDQLDALMASQLSGRLQSMLAGAAKLVELTATIRETQRHGVITPDALNAVVLQLTVAICKICEQHGETGRIISQEFAEFVESKLRIPSAGQPLPGENYIDLLDYEVSGE